MTRAKTTIYAIGDIHGRLDLLDQLYAKIVAHARAHPADRQVLVHLGDYVDRGPDSKGVVERVMRELDGFENIALLGNHEELMLKFLDGNTEAGWWLKEGMGGEETLRSFGVSYLSRRDGPAAKREIDVHILDWLRALKLFHCEGGFYFTHAGVMPGVPLEQQEREHLIWIRDRFINSDLDHGARIVHGHTPSRAPHIRRNRIGLDTGAVWSGNLTCAVLDPERPDEMPLLLTATGAPAPDYTPDWLPP